MIKLIGNLIKTYSNEGDTVLDFCMGSGTTGEESVRLKRGFIGIEKDSKNPSETVYFGLARKRIESEYAKQ